MDSYSDVNTTTSLLIEEDVKHNLNNKLNRTAMLKKVLVSGCDIHPCLDGMLMILKTKHKIDVTNKKKLLQNEKRAFILKASKNLTDHEFLNMIRDSQELIKDVKRAHVNLVYKKASVNFDSKKWKSVLEDLTVKNCDNQPCLDGLIEILNRRKEKQKDAPASISKNANKDKKIKYILDLAKFLKLNNQFFSVLVSQSVVDLDAMSEASTVLYDDVSDVKSDGDLDSTNLTVEESSIKIEEDYSKNRELNIYKKKTLEKLTLSGCNTVRSCIAALIDVLRIPGTNKLNKSEKIKLIFNAVQYWSRERFNTLIEKTINWVKGKNLNVSDDDDLKRFEPSAPPLMDSKIESEVKELIQELRKTIASTKQDSPPPKYSLDPETSPSKSDVLLKSLQDASKKAVKDITKHSKKRVDFIVPPDELKEVRIKPSNVLKFLSPVVTPASAPPRENVEMVAVPSSTTREETKDVTPSVFVLSPTKKQLQQKNSPVVTPVSAPPRENVEMVAVPSSTTREETKDITPSVFVLSPTKKQLQQKNSPVVTPVPTLASQGLKPIDESKKSSDVILGDKSSSYELLQEDEPVEPVPSVSVVSEKSQRELEQLLQSCLNL